ncbi:MAG: PilZ domain-containing protein [Proteobacteria bacterium]|nr:PilZ domain-containing protein [Pseudomonadota bacterium]MBU1709215.1 PilZ domain-containing protein [Pseudomonadota bacterium]
MSPEGVIRQCFRLQLTGSEVITADIKDDTFEIVDLGINGVGITLKYGNLFSVGEELTLSLTLDGKKFSLQGVVVHISPDTYDNFLCGIELINLDKDSAKKFETYFQQHRAKIFQNE